MSRAYRIRVAESVRRTIRVADGVRAELELLEILPRPRMSELLAAELEAAGFRREGGSMRRLEEDGIEVVVDLDARTVTVSLAREAEVERTLERTASVEETRPREPAEEDLRRRTREDLEEWVGAEEAGLAQDVARRLEARLGDIRAELDRATNRALGGALREKAASLGEIEEIVEDPRTGSLTIRVRLGP